MKHIAGLLAVVIALGATMFAHEGNDHVRGVVTAMSATSITVQTAAKSPRTLTVSAKTKFEKSGEPATPGDLKTGDRVVVDVPEHGTDALLVRFGAPKKK